MRKGIFSKLAIQNIRNNKNTYIPYMITCIFCIAMIYMMEFLRDCDTDRAVHCCRSPHDTFHRRNHCYYLLCDLFDLQQQFPDETKTERNRTLQCSRSGKNTYRHCYAAGNNYHNRDLPHSRNRSRVLGSKLALLLLLRLLHIPAVLGFYVSLKGVVICMVMFGGIFLLILFLNLAKIRLNRPVELLHGSNTGEKNLKQNGLWP